MDSLELELELDELGFLFNFRDEYENVWECCSLIISKSNKQNNEKPGLYFQLSYIRHGGNGGWREENYITYFLIEIIKTPTGFVLSELHRKIIEEQNGEIFFDILEHKLDQCKLRLLFLFPQVEIAIKN